MSRHYVFLVIASDRSHDCWRTKLSARRAPSVRNGEEMAPQTVLRKPPLGSYPSSPDPDGGVDRGCGRISLMRWHVMVGQPESRVSHACSHLPTGPFTHQLSPLWQGWDGCDSAQARRRTSPGGLGSSWRSRTAKRLAKRLQPHADHHPGSSMANG